MILVPYFAQMASGLVLVCLKPLDVRGRWEEDILDPGTPRVVICIVAPRSLSA